MLIFRWYKGRKTKLPRHPQEIPRHIFFNICILVYINLHAPFKSTCWLQWCKIKQKTLLDLRVDIHNIPGLLAAQSDVKASPLWKRRKFPPLILSLTITTNEKIYHLVVRLELAQNIPYSIMSSHWKPLFSNWYFLNTFPSPSCSRKTLVFWSAWGTLIWVVVKPCLWVHLEAF